MIIRLFRNTQKQIHELEKSMEDMNKIFRWETDTEEKLDIRNEYMSDKKYSRP